MQNTTDQQQQPNAETQCLMRWADDDREELAYAIVDEVYEYAAWLQRVQPDAKYDPRETAAEALKNWFIDRDPMRDSADVVYTQLMAQALDRVDWPHIVDYLRRRMAEEAAALAHTAEREAIDTAIWRPVYRALDSLL